MRYLLYWYKSANADATHLWQGEDGEEDEIALIRQCAGAGAHFTCFTGTKSANADATNTDAAQCLRASSCARRWARYTHFTCFTSTNVRVMTAAALGQEDYVNMIILALRALTSLRR